MRRLALATVCVTGLVAGSRVYDAVGYPPERSEDSPKWVKSYVRWLADCSPSRRNLLQENYSAGNRSDMDGASE